MHHYIGQILITIKWETRTRQHDIEIKQVAISSSLTIVAGSFYCAVKRFCNGANEYKLLITG